MLRFENHSGIHTLHARQLLPIDLHEAWDFFSSPKNLTKITPEYMRFKITSEISERMYAGQIITYRVAVLPGISTNWVNWVTEITHVNEPYFFVDEQRYGPYSMWHHEHSFEPAESGVLMTDKVSYKIPSWLGGLANSLFVKRQLRGVFEHRASVLENHFKP